MLQASKNKKKKKKKKKSKRLKGILKGPEES